MHFNYIIGIRTHQWTNQEEQLYNKLLQYFSKEQIFVIVDETTKSVDLPACIQKLSLNLAFINAHKLLNYIHYNQSVGWLCGDYFYYVMREHICADFYWLIEPDVGFSFPSIIDFFSQFETVPDDGLVCNFGEIDARSDWFESSHLIHEKAYTCLFPINRLSMLAIDKCKVERQRLSALYAENQSFLSNDNKLGVKFPNDETIVANTLIKENLKINDFKKYFPYSFDFLSYATWFAIPQQEKIYPENQVIHPMRSLDKIVNRVSSKAIENINQSGCLNSLIVNQDNIELLSLQVAKNVARYISDELEKKLKIRNNMLAVKLAVNTAIPTEFSDNSKVWEWNNVVVLDYSYKGFTFVLDFKIKDNGQVECLTFERSKYKSDWLELITNAYDSVHITDGKAVLFTSSIQDVDLKKQINCTLSIFYTQVHLA